MSHRQRRDGGFALPEVLISIVIMSTIATVMVGVVSVVLRNAPTTSARADDARTMQGLVTWLPQDVDSTPPTGFNTDPSAASGCDVSPGLNLLRMEWSERTSSTTTRYIANYRHVGNGTNYRIQRITCSGTTSGTLAGGFAQNVTSELPPLPAGWAPGQAPVAVNIAYDTTNGTVELVTFEITTAAGEIVRTDSAPKNPDMTLPTTTAPSWMPPTPVTAAPPANIPPIPHSFTLWAHAGVEGRANLQVSDPDNDVLTVEIDIPTIPSGWGVALSGTQLRVVPPLAAPAGTIGAINYWVDDARENGRVMGTVSVQVVDSATTPTTSTTTSTTTTTAVTTTTLPVCVVTGSSITPSQVRNIHADNNSKGGIGSVNVGILEEPVTITVQTNGYCGEGIVVKYDSGGANSPPEVNLEQVDATTFRLVLPSAATGSSETWSDGTKTIRIFSEKGGAWGSVSLQVR